MINHVRTLLLNRPASYFTDAACNEYIQPEFLPVPYDTPMRLVHDALFMKGIDPTCENMLVSSLMKVLHAPDMEAYTLAFDPRVTYTSSTQVSELITRVPLELSIVKSGSCDIVPRYRIDISSAPGDITYGGKHSWVFSTGDRYSTVMRYSRAVQSKDITIIPTDSDKRTQYIQLINNYIRAYFELPAGYMTGMYVITYALTMIPTYSLATVFSTIDKLMCRGDVAARMFASSNAYASTLSDLHTMWLNARDINTRLGALLLAFAIQCDGIRSKQGV